MTVLSHIIVHFGLSTITNHKPFCIPWKNISMLLDVSADDTTLSSINIQITLCDGSDVI